MTSRLNPQLIKHRHVEGGTTTMTLFPGVAVPAVGELFQVKGETDVYVVLQVSWPGGPREGAALLLRPSGMAEWKQSPFD